MGKGNVHFLTVWIILAQILAAFSSNTTAVYGKFESLFCNFFVDTGERS